MKRLFLLAERDLLARLIQFQACGPSQAFAYPRGQGQAGQLGGRKECGLLLESQSYFQGLRLSSHERIVPPSAPCFNADLDFVRTLWVQLDKLGNDESKKEDV